MFFSMTKLFGFCVAAGLAITGQTAFSQNLLNNGSFSLNSGGNKIDFSTTASSSATAAIPYWGLVAPTTGTVDTGIQAGIGPSGTTYAAFEQYNGGSIFNLTSTPVTAGTTYMLTFVGEDTSGTTTNTDPTSITFFSQAAPTTTTYTFAGTALQTTSLTLTNKATPYTSYPATFTAPTTTGGNIGIEVTNNSTGDYNQLDSFVLTAAPEPSTYALMAVSLLGLVFLRRRARA